MELQSDYEQLCEQYLLGELSEAAQGEVEQAYFADDSLFARFLAVKDDLIDAYARGDLTGEKRERFEQHFLSSTPRRRRIDETRELIQAVSGDVALPTAKPTTLETAKSAGFPIGERLANYFRRPLVWRIGFAALLVAAIAIGWIVLTQLQRRSSVETARDNPSPSEISPTQLPSPSPRQDNTTQATTSSPTPTPQPGTTVRPSPQPSSAQLASIALYPVSSRDAGSSNSLTLSPEVQIVHLSLVFAGAAQNSFDVSLRTVDGELVLRRSNLKSSSNGTTRSVKVTFNPSILRRQDYIATLSVRGPDRKLETIGEYYFKVNRTAP